MQQFLNQPHNHFVHARVIIVIVIASMTMAMTMVSQTAA
jgi:hypothetical protein